jgi:hypothetical protein
VAVNSRGYLLECRFVQDGYQPLVPAAVILRLKEGDASCPSVEAHGGIELVELLSKHNHGVLHYVLGIMVPRHQRKDILIKPALMSRQHRHELVHFAGLCIIHWSLSEGGALTNENEEHFRPGNRIRARLVASYYLIVAETTNVCLG